MSDWVHCNECFRLPGDGTKFSLTNCGHIYCQRCVTTAGKDTCKLCGNKCSTILLASKMKPDVEKFFCDPVELNKRHQNEMSQVLEFQRSHRNRLSSYQRHKLNKQGSMLGQAQRAFEQHRELQRKNQELQEENLYLKKLISNMGGPNSQRGTTGRNLMPRPQSHGISPSQSRSQHSSPATYSSSSQRIRTAGRERSPQNGTPQGKRLSVRPPPSQGRIGTPGMTPSPSQHGRYTLTPTSQTRDASPMLCSPGFIRNMSGKTPGVPIEGSSTPTLKEGGGLSVFLTPSSHSQPGSRGSGDHRA